MSNETYEQIAAEADGMSTVTNPATGSQRPIDTTRSPAAITVDLKKVQDIEHRFDAEVFAETGKTYPLNGRLYWNLHYLSYHYKYERACAIEKGNN
jgi:hypothetical protein